MMKTILKLSAFLIFSCLGIAIAYLMLRLSGSLNTWSYEYDIPYYFFSFPIWILWAIIGLFASVKLFDSIELKTSAFNVFIVAMISLFIAYAISAHEFTFQKQFDETLVFSLQKNVDEEQLVVRENVTYEVNSKLPFSGIGVNYYDDEKKSAAVFFEKGLATGLAIGWYENGIRKIEVRSKEGSYHGIQLGWFDNGQKMSEEYFIFGVNHGDSLYWYKNGQRRLVSHFIKGDLDGLTTMWYENGQKEYEGTYRKGKKDGVHNQWREDSVISSSIKYRYGVEVD